ncbi:hypothetical protein BT96DRAFT_1088684 [Gymnopus androsaceus JB14]|uniref:Reverse transcriptase domain-containing protein n=1 Tax=Gymnopus androsaceus JB14 TaxID=1447944 RepID=A0A6A4GJQ8_9AGAR|nr:hypothetical protein BT96DRAFT_1088684 [Gymnopus androsaceus JB14]
MFITSRKRVSMFSTDCCCFESLESIAAYGGGMGEMIQLLIMLEGERPRRLARGRGLVKFKQVCHLFFQTVWSSNHRYGQRVGQWKKKEKNQTTFIRGKGTEEEFGRNSSESMKFRAMGKTLYVATVDITNAFPSTDRATLWLKLKMLGMSGKLFDWIRMIYALMQYKVCHENELSNSFGADIGIMIGDTLSHEFWILYMADFEIPPTADDIELMGMLISHLEQADDLLLLALSAEGLQRKMDIFYQWCRVNFLIINAIKSGISYHGPAPAIMPVFRFGNSPVALLMEYVYVGMHFCTGNYRVFSSLIKPHFVEKTQKARKTAHAVLHVESMIGTLPVHEGKILYMGCVDPTPYLWM